MPIPLDVCPCCGEGIKPARGWTWIEPAPFLDKKECKFKGTPQEKNCAGCPMHQPPKRVGLLWIGEKFYPTPEAWQEESQRLGVSRRIASIPKGFELGRDWVYVAHRKTIPGASLPEKDCPLCQGSGITTAHGSKCRCTYGPAIFHAFKPDRIEYVTKGDETEEQLADMVKRHITPVKVVREGEFPNLAGQEEE